jgi:hypothetical protein
MLAASDVVRVYQSLSQAECAFCSIKIVDLKIRPIHYRLSGRVRAHELLCMLACYLEWHMRQALAPILFDNHQRPRRPPREPRSSLPCRLQSRASHDRHSANDGLPAHGFQSLLAELATFTRNTIAMTACSARHLPALPATHSNTDSRLRKPPRAAPAVGSKSPPLTHYPGSSLFVAGNG